MPVLAVIPARLGSTRLPRKPLQILGGAPLIVRVWERIRDLPGLDEVVVATDAPEIRSVVEQAGGKVAMTSRRHESGTDRVAEVAARPEHARFDVIVNVQGDEPFLPTAAVAASVDRIREGDDVGTAAVPLDPALRDDPARVKVVTDARGRALYFSRAPIPFYREPGAAERWPYWQHLGIYAYTRPALERWVGTPPTALEQAERLEQLRALDQGISIGVAHLAEPALPGIDTPDDLARAERHWNAIVIGGTA